jgi:putative hydrolase of the HAD superfamily
MDIKAIAFDANGTLIQVQTEDHSDEVFRAAAHLLTYQGIDLRRHRVRELYLSHLAEQRQASGERHAEFDAVAIWRRIVDENATDYTRAMPSGKSEQLPLIMAEMQRGISRRRLRLYPHVRRVLDTLAGHFSLALITDAQSTYARAELRQVGLLDYFDPIIVSGEHGFRKPDRRMFTMALQRLGVDPEHVLYVGNDMLRDVHGAGRVGMRTALFDSDQGRKTYRDCAADFTITDHRQLLEIVGL